jgi:hypothetical protein
VRPRTSETLHHVEIWVPNLGAAVASIGWLLEALGYTPCQSWDIGRSWQLGPTGLVIEQSPALVSDRHRQRRPELNHLAFYVANRPTVDALTGEAARHGWYLLLPHQYPHATGDQQYTAYLENTDGFEVELVADVNHPEAGFGTALRSWGGWYDSGQEV